MHTTISGARINFERQGAGLPLFFLHAGIADLRMWEPQVDAFAVRFDVTRPDQRGFGKSELPPGPWSPVADLLALGIVSFIGFGTVWHWHYLTPTACTAWH